MNDDKIKALYNQLKDDGYTLDNEDTFREDLQNDESFRRQIYNSQKKVGYDMGGNFNSWQGRLMKSFSAPPDNNKQQTPKQSPNTSAGSHAQQVVNEYDESVRREQENNTISNNQQARTQFVPEASNVRGATIPKDSPLRQQYPYLRDISDKDQVYFRTDTNEPLFTWADNEGNDLTQEEAAILRQRAEIEQNDSIKPHQVPLTSLQLPEGSAVGIKTDMKISDYADELLKKQYGENYSQGTLTDANGNSISAEELRNNLAQQTYNDLNKDVANARKAINEAGYDKQAVEKIVNNVYDKWKGLVGKERMRNALMQGNEPDARQPDLFDSISKSVRAGFIRAGAGLLDTMQSLASNLYIEDASSPTGYSRTRSYAEALADKNDPLTQASNYLNKRADTLSREAQPYQGQKGFLDMLWDGDIEGFLQKGVATAGESLPMTLSAFNPYTMTINAISMAGNNFRNNTLENPDIPAWKRAAMAIGSAAIEQATEKYSDPIFKYIGGNKILRGTAKKYAQSVTNDVTQKATETLARRIYNRLANITKDAVGEGLEEVIGNVGNDILGQTLDLISGNEDYGLKAQWNQAKKENPDITLADFAKNKAKESIESFIGGAMAGAYTSGSAQLTNKALQYTFDTLGGAEETQATGRINPINVDVAQSYDDGYTAEESNELNNTKIRYEFNRDKVAVTLGVTPEQVDETIGDPIEFISKAQQEGRVQAVQPVIDYINSKASYDGMIDRVRDDIDSRIEASNKLIKERTNTSTEMIQPATLKAVSEDGKDQVVYVVGGNVIMLDDGTGVDKEKSDGSILVRHADTSKLEMVSPDAILKVDAPIDPQVERETAAQNIRMTYAQNKADSIDGKVAFVQGDVYTLTDEAGKVAQVTVVPNKDGIVDNGDGTVNVDAGTGEVVAMPKDAIQSMVDATNYNKVAQESEGGIQQGQQEISYEAGDEIKVTDDNGNVVTASIMQSRDPEGRYLIQTETPIKGQKVNKFSASEIEAIKYTEPAEQNASVQDVQSPTEQSSVPIDNEGRPVYEEAEPSAAWNAIMQEANNDMQLAQNVVDSMVADKEAELSKLEKSKAKGGKTISEKIAAENARQAAIEQARASLAQWGKIQQQAQQPQATTTEQPAAEQEPAEQVTEQPSAEQQPTNEQQVEQQPTNEQQVEQTQAATAQEEQKPAIPTDEKGNMLYHQVPVETTINDLYDGKLDDNEIRDFVDANISEADKNLEKINKKAPKIGINKAEYLKKKQEWQKQVEDATRISDYWNSVKDYIAKQTHTTPEEIKAAQDELSGEAARREYQDMGGSVQQDAVSVASDFIRGAKITPESFKAETGYGTDEQRKFVGMIAKAEKGGKTIDRLAEELVSYDNAEMNGVLFGGDTSSAKDAILSALQGAGTRGELKQTNEAEEQAYIDARNAARDEQYMEQYGMTYEEYLAYEEQIMPTIWREYNNYDETAFNNMYAEEIEQLIKSRENDTTGEKQADDRGNQVLSEQQVTEQRGSADGTEPGTEVQAGVQGTDENAAAPEETQQQAVAQKIATAEAETDTNPTEGQKEAGNYKKGHVRIDGYDITIEQPKGSVRRGTDADGKQWEQTMNNTYGYIRGTEGVDGDHIDIFLSDNPTEGNVYVVDQVNPDGSFDEHKVMYGFQSAEDARAAYLSNYEEGWQGLGTITEVSKEEFKKWVNSSKRKTKPFAEYKSVNGRDESNGTDGTDASKDGGGVRLRLGENGAKPLSAEETAIRDAVVGRLRGSGLEVITDTEEGQRVLDEANGRGERVRTQAMLDGLAKAADTIHSWIKGNKRGRVFTIELPESTQRKIKEAMGRDFDSHNITANGIAHALKNHGVKGNKLNKNSIPLREEDAELIPYIMTAPDYVKKASTDVSGRESVRFYKELSNGYVVVVEKEYKNSPDDMETITMWAETSSEATNARQEAVPDTHVQNAILSTDAAKIRKDAETAIENDRKIREQRVYHGSGADFESFDHSHMGEGEGAQAYGWGSYVTEVEGIGKAYAESTSGNIFKSGFGDFYLREIRNGLSEGKRFEDIKQKLLNHHAEMYEKANGNTDMYGDFISDYETLRQLEERDLPKRNLYTVEIPDNTGENYLDWNGRADKIIDKVGITVDEYESNDISTGRDVYEYLNQKLGSDKAASEFLSRAGFVGISYPAEYRSGGREDNARNYVIFDEKDLKITDHVRFFRTPNGEAYGFTVGGRIYVDPRVATADTPIHEYAHLWASALRQGNPEEWRNVVGLMKGTPVWDEVRRRYPELTADDDIADEVLATYSGRRGAERLKAETRKAVDGKGVFEAAQAVTAMGRVKEALRKFWKGVADFLHIHYTSAEEVADRVMSDLLEGVKPSEVTIKNEKVNGETGIEEANRRFNEEIERYQNGEMDKNDMFHLGNPQGVMRMFLPELPIVMRQRIMTKGSVKKHNIAPTALENMPQHLSEPIFVFRRTDNVLGVLTEMKDRDGKNVCVAISLSQTIQDGKDVLEVNDIRSVHGRNETDVIYPIVQNNTLVWADKEKGLAWLSSASQSVQQEIDKQDLVSAANIVRNFENPSVGEENVYKNSRENAEKHNDVRYRKADDKISDFAQKHNLNEKDVEDYADYIRRGNLNGASRAFKEIRRKVRLDNQGASLGQFTKIFSPIEKELYERFGNLDDLRQQYVQRTLDERNAMEAARKKAEEEAEAERRRLQEFQNMSSEQLDAEYMKAVEANDESRMRDLVNEAARRNGYGDTDSEYQGVGAWAAPSNPGYESDEERRAAVANDAPDVNITDIAEGYSSQPDDYFTNLRAYGTDTPHGRESAEAINNAIDEVKKGKDPMVKVYRAVPKTVKEGKLRNGDWVTPSRKYAEMHGDNRLEGNYRIIEQEVPASQIWWDGNDINEWGFDDGKGYAYRNTKNNRKLNDLITRDDKGNIIPLSQRFNARKSDVRYRFIGETGARNLDAAEEATTRLDNLSVAREMEDAGKDAKTIKIATGWERGADGKWRYETEDFEFKEKPIVADFDGYSLTTLDSLINDDELFKAYSQLSDILVQYQNLPSAMLGSYSSKTSISPAMITLSHEFKERKENPEWRKKVAEMEKEPVIKSWIDAMDREPFDMQAYEEAERNFKSSSLWDEYNNLLKGQGDIPRYVPGFSGKQVLAHEIQHAIQDIEGFSSGANTKNKQYKESAGEVEARNVEARINMTPEERRQSLASETEDVAREDQLFIYDNLGVNARQGAGALTDSELSNANDPAGKMLGKPSRTPAQQRAFAERERQRMADRAREVADILHLDNVEIVTDANTLQGRRAKAKGFYSHDNGKIVIVVPNHVDMADIEQTVLHEAVAHYGLRKLFGEHFDTFLDNVFQNAEKGIQERIAQIEERLYQADIEERTKRKGGGVFARAEAVTEANTKRRNGDYRKAATEEYLASLAENTNFENTNASWWNKIKDLFLSMVRSIGLKGFSGKTLSDNELRYILWRSYENLKNPGRYRNVFGGAEDIAMQNRLKVGNYAIFDDKSKVAELLYRESDGTSPLSGSIIEAWDKTAKSMKFQLKETFVDYLNALDKFQKLVEKYSKKKIQEFENAYDWMSFLSSKNRQEMDAFDSFIVKPLNNAISKIIGEENAKKKWNWEEGPLRELVMYVEAKHGTDRNRQMAVEKFINDFEEDLSFFEKADINFDKEGYDRELGKAGKDAYEKAYRKEFEKLTKEISAEFSDEQRNDVENRAAKAGEKASEKAKEKFKQETVEKLNKQYKEKLYKDWIKSKKDINSLPNITWAEKQKLLDSAAQTIGADISQDYSGLSSVFGDKEQYPNPWEQEAVDFVERYEQNHTTENLDEMWNAIDNATGYALQKQYESGLVSKEYIERQKERFDNYIPLRGFADEVAGDVYNYMENEFYPGGNPVKSAHGRTSEAGNPFGSILNTAYSSISSGNKNMAKMAFYSMVANHDTQGLAVVQKAWMIKYSSLQDDPELMSVVKMPEIEAGEDVPEWVEAVPKLPSDVNLGESAETEKMRTEMLNNFEQVMKRLQREGAAKPISKKSKVRYKTLFKQRDEHEIPLFIAGDKYIVTITGNPRVAQAINGLLNPDVENDGLTQLAKRTQQLMSAAFTAKNPAFSIANLSKDTIDANNQVFIRENPRYWAKFTKNQKAGFGAYPKMMSMLHQYQNGTLDLTKGDSKLFKEFMDNGGATGYTFVNTQDEYAKELAKKLKHLSESAPRFFSAKATLKTVFDAIEFAGQSAELVNRFAAYKTSRNMGRAINRSIRDAKEITVNFNRKGAGRKSVDKNKSWYSPINIASAISQYGRTNILFWNAGIQAKYKLYRNLKDYPIKTSVSLMGGCLALSALGLPLLNNMLLPALYAIFGFGSDDDKEDYYNALTDWERTHNICVRLPKGWWLKIPLSPEMTPWVTMGDAIGGAVSGQRELSSSDFIKSVIDVTSPISINWQYKPEMMPLNFAPTVTQPILQNMMNVNFMGNPIKKTSFDRFKDYKPEYLMVYKSTSPTFIELSRLSNRLGGGKDDKTSGNLADWNPALLQNFITGYTGGYGQTFISIADWIVNTSKGEEQAVTFSRMPLVSRFAISGNKDVKITRINQKYNEVRKFIGEFDYDKKTYKEEVKKAREEHDLMKEAEAISNYEQLLRSKRASLYLRLKSTDKSLKKYEEYLEEFPDDEQTKNLYMNIKTDAVELFKNERP